MADTLDKTTLLTPDNAIPLNISPTGVRYVSEPIKGSHLYLIKPRVLKDGEWTPDDRHKVPTELEGKFTGPKRSEEAIRCYLIAVWNKSLESKRKPKEVSNASDSNG